MMKRYSILSTILAFVGVSILSVPVFAAGTYDGGNGSPEEPFQIAEPNNLIEMSQHPEDWGLNFILTADLNMNLADPNTFTTALIAPDTSIADGFQGTYFTGTFDGNGHTISNLTIDTVGVGNDNLGLFGIILGSNAWVKDLGLENVNITGGYDSIELGGLVGFNMEGTINNCYALVNIISGDASQSIGGLVGGNAGEGSIINCYTTVNIIGGDDSYWLGGLCGFNFDSSISNCYSTGAVTGGDNSSYLGGLCGENDNVSISNCYATGSVTGGDNSSYLGGLCGNILEGSIQNCYATGAVTGGNVSEYLGGLCGENYDGSISSCYFLDTAGPDNGYGTPLTDSQMKQQSSFVGWDFDPFDGDPADWVMPLLDYPKLSWQRTITYDGQTDITLVKGDSSSIQIDVYSAVNETLNWTITGHESCAWITGLDPNSGTSSGPADRITVTIDISTVSLNYGVYNCALSLSADDDSSVIIPIRLNVLFHLSGSGTEADPFLIEDFDDLQVFSNINVASIYWASGVYTRLDCDLDLNPNLPGRNIYTTAIIASDNNPAGGFDGVPFSGVFNGNGHTISNLTIDDAGANNIRLGLFGQIEGPNAEVKNLGLENVNITGGYIYYGALCGVNTGNISNCFASGSIKGSSHFGGLCGANSGSIINCYARGSVIGGGYSRNLGGLCGANSGSISYCYADGSVTGGDGLGGLCGGNEYGSISYCFADGSVTGDDYLGGLCGSSWYGSINNCYASGSVTGGGGNDSRILGGLCGLNYDSSIGNCYATGSVTSGNNSRNLGGLCGSNVTSISNISNCYASGSVTGGDNSQRLGGLCGGNSGSIINCYAIGLVTGGDNSIYLGGLCGSNTSSISICYASGSVTGGNGSSKLGGLCGNTYNCIVSSCYFLDTAGPDNKRGTPLTDSQMKQQSSFIGWDFHPFDGDPADWFMPFMDYPILYWQLSIAYYGQTTITLEQGDSSAIQIVVFSVADETLNWTITGHEACDWIINLDPNSGSSSGPADLTIVTMEIDTTDLSLGDYSCILTLAPDDGASIVVPVSLQVYYRVDLEELSLLSQYWLMTGCDQTQPCSAADWYIDHTINMFDFNQLAKSWLEQSIITQMAIGWTQPSLLIPWHSDVQAVVMPYVAPDKLTMFYSRYNDPNGYWEIVEATRTYPRGNFPTTRFYPELNGGIAPWLSTDRLRMYYNEIVDDISIMKVAERVDPNSPWMPVRTISEIQESGYSDYRPTLTADELTMFWSSDRPAGTGITSSIWMATRSSISEPFANVTHVNELDIHTYNSAPCILPNGLTIYFHATTTGHPWRFYKATRNSLQEPFSIIGEVKMLDDSSFDGQTIFVTPDEKDLYFYSQWMGLGEGIHVSYYESLTSNPKNIHRGTALVDGDLSDWSSQQEWIDLDQIYSGDPNDVTEARVAFRWDPDTNKVYAAVVVTDVDHVFSDEYDVYDASDRIEIYTQGSAAGGTGFYNNYGIAQHYMVGPDTAGGSWGTWALGQTIDPNANFEYAVQVVGNQIIYEIGFTQFDYYGGIAGGDSILTDLYPGRTIRLDIIAGSRHASGFGMRSENLMTGKYFDADKFAPYLLIE